MGNLNSCFINKIPKYGRLNTNNEKFHGDFTSKRGACNDPQCQCSKYTHELICVTYSEKCANPECNHRYGSHFMIPEKIEEELKKDSKHMTFFEYVDFRAQH